MKKPARSRILSPAESRERLPSMFMKRRPQRQPQKSRFRLIPSCIASHGTAFPSCRDVLFVSSLLKKPIDTVVKNCRLVSLVLSICKVVVIISEGVLSDRFIWRVSPIWSPYAGRFSTLSLHLRFVRLTYAVKCENSYVYRFTLFSVLHPFYRGVLFMSVLGPMLFVANTNYVLSNTRGSRKIFADHLRIHRPLKGPSYNF